MLTQQEIQNILILIAKTPISGQEAMTVAILQQKLNSMLEIRPETKEVTEKEMKKD